MNTGGSRSSSGRSESSRRSPLLELRDLILLRQEATDSSTRCQSQSYVSGLNSTSERSSSKLRQRDKRISGRRIKKRKSSLIQPRKSRMQGMLEKLKTMLDVRKSSKISKSSRRRSDRSENKGSLKHMRRSTKRRRTRRQRMNVLPRS